MLESLDGRVMPDATPLAPPPGSPPGQTEPSGVVIDNLQPGSWVPLDGTTTIAEDGVWLAVGAESDVWIVANVASNPTFYQIGYLVVPEPGGTNGENYNQPPGPIVPPGGPALPPPVIPPSPNNTNVGGLVGGLGATWNGFEVDYPIALGIGITAPANPQPGAQATWYFTIPGDGQYIIVTRLGFTFPQPRD